MAKTLGIIFGSLIASILVMFIEHIYSQGFLYAFFKSQSIGIAATVLALNVATVTFLLGHLFSIEKSAKMSLFTKTKKEVRDNVYFMFFLFAALVALVSVLNPGQALIINSTSYNPIVLFSLLVFTLIFVCLFEIITIIFTATEFVIDTTKKG